MAGFGNSDDYMKGEIIFIAGEGRSGSTLFDIVLGAQENAFSCGELQNFTKKGLVNEEFCSCGQRVPQCSFWSEVSARWSRERTLSLEEYNLAWLRYFGSYKRVFGLLKNAILPSKQFSDLVNDTEKLYDAIFALRGNDLYLIDSSKLPLRILLLKKMKYKVRVMHTVRQLHGVILSRSKSFNKNPKKGIEHDIHPVKPVKTMISWSLSNMLTILFSIGLNRNKVRYEELIESPYLIIEKQFPHLDSQYKKVLQSRGPFRPLHVVAGNRLRMQETIYVEQNGSSNQNAAQSAFIVKVLNSIFY